MTTCSECKTPTEDSRLFCLFFGRPHPTLSLCDVCGQEKRLALKRAVLIEQLCGRIPVPRAHNIADAP